MKKGGVGGANTNASGLPYEDKVAEELRNELTQNGFREIESLRKQDKEKVKLEVYKKSDHQIEIAFKNAFYKEFIEELGIDYKNLFSARLIPDIVLINKQKKKVTIIEVKNQTGSGSVLEKLQTCDYKYYYYSKLLAKHNYQIQIVWRLGKYFQDNSKSLQSVYEYMLMKNSIYYFEKIPIEIIIN